MEESKIEESERSFSELKEILSASTAAGFLFKNSIGIVVILDFIKAHDWPFRGQSFINEPTEKIPLVWAILTASDSHNLRMVWDIHPTKCFPIRYNQHNPNAKEYLMPVIKEQSGTLGGCSRTFVNISNRRYEVNEKTPQYCSIFGLPDDCYDPYFEKRMLDTLMRYGELDIWCFERTAYTAEKLDPQIRLHYMKGEFLPSRYFMYKDTPEHFLKGVNSSKQLESLSGELWYSSGRELIEEMNLDNNEYGFRFEEQARYYIRKRLIYEFARLSLLLMKRDSFSSFSFVTAPKLCLDNEQEVQTCLENITMAINRDKERHVFEILSKINKYIDFQSFKNSRFMVMDVEYIHVPYPTGSSARFFNFPCIFSNVIWQGVREGLSIKTNVFVIPCHFCEQTCGLFKKKLFKYDCLAYGFECIEKQSSLVEEMLSKHNGFKIYTYGRSDVFQLEQGSDFFSDSFERRRYERRNRKRAQRIVDISQDLSIPDKALDEIEHEILERWLVGWNREKVKVNVNSRFMKRYESSRWEANYYEAINSCLSDTVSAFLFLIFQKYKGDDIIRLG